MEAVGDYEYYTRRLTRPLRRSGVNFLDLRDHPFRVKLNGHIILYKPTDASYYFLAPGKDPHVETGVMTDDDLKHEAQEYLGITVSGKNSRTHSSSSTESDPEA